MIRSNEEKIIALFSALLLNVRRALQSHNVEVDDVRQFLVSFFKKDLADTHDLCKLFDTISIRGLWDHNNYGPLEKLTDHLLPDDPSIERFLKDYKSQLSGFHMAVKLVDYMEYQNLLEDVANEEPEKMKKLSIVQYRKIKLVLEIDRKVSELSLDYVHKLWRSVADEYELPSLTGILDKIVAGSLEITWFVPVHVAQLMTTPRPKFFKKHHIVLVFIDDVKVYDEELIVSTLVISYSVVA